MKVFYEQKRDIVERISIERSTDHFFPVHFHEQVEIFAVKKGTQVLSINGKEISVTDGTVVIIDSYEFHGYFTHAKEGNDDCIMIVPNKYLQNFIAQKNGKRLSCNIVQNYDLAAKIIDLMESYILYAYKDDYLIQSHVDMILSLLLQYIPLIDQPVQNEPQLMKDILTYISSHFTEEINIAVLQKETGYSAGHISRMFNSALNMSLPTYVNIIRLKYIEDKIKNNKKANITELIYDAGFNSTRSYYWAKNKLNSLTDN